MTSSAAVPTADGFALCSVHPVVLFTVTDSYTRRAAGQPRVVGALLGSREGRKLVVRQAYTVPHSEANEQVRSDGSWPRRAAQGPARSARGAMWVWVTQRDARGKGGRAKRPPARRRRLSLGRLPAAPCAPSRATRHPALPTLPHGVTARWPCNASAPALGSMRGAIQRATNAHLPSLSHLPSLPPHCPRLAPRARRARLRPSSTVCKGHVGDTRSNAPPTGARAGAGRPGCPGGGRQGQNLVELGGGSRARALPQTDAAEPSN